MVHYNGPYPIIQAWPDCSTYTLKLPESMNIFPTFYVFLLYPYVNNDASLFPSYKDTCPSPIVSPNGEDEWFIDHIFNRKRIGCSFHYLIHWCGYSPKHDLWQPGYEVQECKALNVYLYKNNLDDT